MPDERVRAFMAIDMPAAAKSELATIARQMGAALPRRAVRWVRPAQMHLTLKFLGDTAVSQLTAVTEVLDMVGKQTAPFTLALGAAGCFPNRRRPRVIWVGLTGEETALARLHALQAAIETSLISLGWEREKRPFRPHLTLGRVKDARGAQKLNWDVVVAPEVVGITAVVLMKSELTPAGAVYTPLHISKLAGGE